MKNKKCPLCKDGRLSRKKVKTVYTYKDISVTIMQPGLWCNSCGEGFLNSKEMQVAMNAINKEKKKREKTKVIIKKNR